MPEDRINEIKDAVRKIMQMIIERNKPLSEEEKHLLLQVIQHAEKLVEEIRFQQSSVEGLHQMAKQPLTPGPYPSSNINAFRYDPKTQKLLVKFMGKDTADSGPIYGYENIPEFIFDVFRRGAVGPKTTGKNKYHAWFKGVTPSLGAAMNALIKAGGYSYTRIS